MLRIDFICLPQGSGKLGDTNFRQTLQGRNRFFLERASGLGQPGKECLDAPEVGGSEEGVGRKCHEVVCQLNRTGKLLAGACPEVG